MSLVLVDDYSDWITDASSAILLDMGQDAKRRGLVMVAKFIETSRAEAEEMEQLVYELEHGGNSVMSQLGERLEKIPPDSGVTITSGTGIDFGEENAE